MDFFKLTINHRQCKLPIIEFRKDDGEKRATEWMQMSNVQSVQIEKINEATYIRNTRPGE